MKLLNRVLSLMLAATLLVSLCACSGTPDADPTPSPSAEESPSAEASPSPDSFTVDTAVEDLTLATMGIPGDFELFSVNGHPVRACLYMYWLSYYMSYLESMGYPLDLTNNPDLVEYLKSDSLNTCIQYALIEAKMDELDCTLSQDLQDSLDSNISMYKIMLGSEEAFNETLRQIGLDYDTYYLLNAVSYYATALQQQLFPDKPSADELATYIQENDILYAKHILFLTVDPTTNQPLEAEKVAEQKSAAEDVLKQLQNSENLRTEFDSLMFLYSEDSGLTSNPNGYIFTANEMVEAFESATRSLEFGQISGLVESPFGYHIILRLDPANDTDDVAASCQSAKMDDQITAWLEESEIVVSDEFEALDIADFYTKYSAYAMAFAEQENTDAGE